VAGLTGSNERVERWARADWLWLAGLLSVALAVRLAFLSQVAFPSLDDPAFYLQTAENLVQGKGLVVDAVWSYQIPWATPSHPSHEYWMPLTTFLIAGAYRLLGVSLRSGQVPGLLFSLGLVALTYRLARSVLAQRLPAVATASLVAVSGTLAYQAVSADSSAPFALLGMACLWVVAEARRRGRTLAFLLAGILIGLAYLTRPDGLFLWIVAGVAWWPYIKDVRKGWPLVALSGAGFALCAAPWLVRNVVAFGSPVPGGTLDTVLQLNYTDTFHFPYTLAVPSLAELVGVRLQALAHGASTWLLAGFPYAVASVFGIAAWRKPVMRVAGVYLLLLLVLLALLFPVPVMAGTVYHSVGAALPFTAVAGVGGLAWISERFGARRRRAVLAALLALAVLLSLGQAALSLKAVGDFHRRQARIYGEAGQWLVEHTRSPVVTPQPYTLNYVTKLPAVALPSGQPPETVREVARRYGAEYVCLTQQFGLYPDAMRTSAMFQLAYRGDGFEIYRVVP